MNETTPPVTFTPLPAYVAAGRIVHQGTAPRRDAGSPCWRLNLIASGQRWYGAASPRYKASKGDMVLTEPGTPQHHQMVNPDGTWSSTWIHFHPRDGWDDLLDWPIAQNGLRCRQMENTLQFRTLYRMAYRVVLDCTRPDPHKSRWSLNSLERLLLMCRDFTTPFEQDTDPLIMEVMAASQLDLQKNWTVPAMAKKTGLSESRFAHRFRKEIGLPPMRWLEHRRMQRARELLHLSDLPVKDIAAQVGFTNPLHFSMRFKAVTGQSPRAFRKQYT